MRRRRSMMSAFGAGVLWATTAAGAFVGGMAILGPPSPDNHHFMETLFGGDTAPALGQWARLPRAIEVDAAVELVPSPTRNAGPPSLEIEAHRVLARSIQQELVRVGCFSGSTDGNWSEATRSAMSEFVAGVGARLPVAAPDYILLTLLQGHTAKACGGAPTRVAVPRNSQKRSPGPREVAIAPPPVEAAPPATTVVIAPPAPVPAVRPQVTFGEFKTTLSNELAAPGAAAPLPGRMAVGAPLPSAEPGDLQPIQGAPLLADGPKAVAPARARPAVTRAESNRRAESTFARIARNAP